MIDDDKKNKISKTQKTSISKKNIDLNEYLIDIHENLFSKKPSRKEVNFIKKMKSLYGLTDKYIYAGYVIAQKNNARSFAYLKKLIPNWVEENRFESVKEIEK